VGLQSEEDEFIEHFKRWPANLFPGVTTMLEELAHHYQLAALSNSNALHWPRVMQEMNLQAYIPDCISSHQIRIMKPDRKAFEAVLHRLDVDAEAVLFLDDLQASIDTASGMGMQAVKVTGTRGGVETVRSLGLI
jgi:putative hydrolase of the HAD superfamily